MVEPSQVEILLILQDPEADPADLEAQVQDFYDQLEQISEQVDRVAAAALPADSDYLPKGDKTEPGILDIKLNLSQLQGMGKWLYERLVGTTTEATLEYKPDGEIKLQFKGKSQTELSAYMQEVQQFISTVEEKRQQAPKVAEAERQHDQ